MRPQLLRIIHTSILLCIPIGAYDASQRLTNKEFSNNLYSLSQSVKKFRGNITHINKLSDKQIANNEAHSSHNTQQVTFPQIEREAEKFSRISYDYELLREALNTAVGTSDLMYNIHNATHNLLDYYILPTFLPYEDMTLYAISYPFAEYLLNTHYNMENAETFLSTKNPRLIRDDAKTVRDFLNKKDQFRNIQDVFRVQQESLHEIDETTRMLNDGIRKTEPAPQKSRYHEAREHLIPYCGWVEVKHIIQYLLHHGETYRLRTQAAYTIRMLHFYREACQELLTLSRDIHEKTICDTHKKRTIRNIKEKVYMYNMLSQALLNMDTTSTSQEHHDNRIDDKRLIIDSRVTPGTYMYTYYLPPLLPLFTNEDDPLSVTEYNTLSHVIRAVDHYLHALHKTAVAYEAHHQRISQHDLVAAQVVCNSLDSACTLLDEEQDMYHKQLDANYQASTIIRSYIKKLTTKRDKKFYNNTRTAINRIRERAQFIENKQDILKRLIYK